MAIDVRTPRRVGLELVRESGFADFLRSRLVGAALLGLALASTLWPTPTLLVLVAAVAAALAFIARRVLAVGVALAGTVVGLAAWPVLTVVAIGVFAVALLAWGAPPYGFALALAIFGFEGSIKAGLTYSGNPLPVSAVALGAVLVDVALVIGVAGLLVADRGRSLRTLWGRLGVLGRVSAALGAGWVIASVVQIPLSGRVTDAVLGFRLTQGYAVGILAGIALASIAGNRAKLILLVAVSPVVFYAGARVLLGPGAVEEAFTRQRPGVTQYGEAIRATGSFSGAVGLVSFVVPVAALATGLLLCSARNRVWASALLVCALTAITASYTRAALVAAGVAAVCALILLFTVGPRSRSRRLAALAVIAALFAGGGAATILASSASPQVDKRLDAFLHPKQDRSLQIRLVTWRTMLDDSWRHPTGSGLGTVGSASGSAGKETVTADDSYLKILREQGLLIGSIFVLAILLVCLAVVGGLRRCTAEARPLGIAALAGFISFLVLAGFGEYIEQPGKALAWTLLGIAVWQAHQQSEPIP
jgi:hypothetical protein